MSMLIIVLLIKALVWCLVALNYGRVVRKVYILTTKNCKDYLQDHGVTCTVF